jgi:hypothetical protein
LRSDRQAAYALTGRSKDRVAERRRKRRHARLADAARRDLDAVKVGDSSMRTTGKSLKLLCSTRPFLSVISPYFASDSPITAAPSICERMRSGLATKPQSITVSTRGTE